MPVSGGCSFTNGTCGYEIPPQLWKLHTEAAGAIMFGNVDGDTGGKFLIFNNISRYEISYVVSMKHAEIS